MSKPIAMSSAAILVLPVPHGSVVDTTRIVSTRRKLTDGSRVDVDHALREQISGVTCCTSRGSMVEGTPVGHLTVAELLQDVASDEEPHSIPDTASEIFDRGRAYRSHSAKNPALRRRSYASGGASMPDLPEMPSRSTCDMSFRTMKSFVHPIHDALAKGDYDFVKSELKEGFAGYDVLEAIMVDHGELRMPALQVLHEIILSRPETATTIDIASFVVYRVLEDITNMEPQVLPLMQSLARIGEIGVNSLVAIGVCKIAKNTIISVTDIIPLLSKVTSGLVVDSDKVLCAITQASSERVALSEGLTLIVTTIYTNLHRRKLEIPTKPFVEALKTGNIAMLKAYLLFSDGSRAIRELTDQKDDAIKRAMEMMRLSHRNSNIKVQHNIACFIKNVIAFSPSQTTNAFVILQHLKDAAHFAIKSEVIKGLAILASVNHALFPVISSAFVAIYCGNPVITIKTQVIQALGDICESSPILCNLVLESLMRYEITEHQVKIQTINTVCRIVRLSKTTYKNALSILEQISRTSLNPEAQKAMSDTLAVLVSKDPTLAKKARSITQRINHFTPEEPPKRTTSQILREILCCADYS